MKKTLKTILNLTIVTAFLLFNTLHTSAAGISGQTREQTLAQIYALGDYNPGSVYGPQLKKSELDQVAEAVLQFVESYDWTEMDDFEKVYCAHQYLCDLCVYAPDWSKNRANTAWGALVYGEAQCSGYARAFKALCDAIGIGCYYVHADENAWNPDHQWNEVCVDGEWYIIDVQCNDDAGFPVIFLVSGETYFYFSGMSWNHDGLPECTKDYFYEEEECGQTPQEVLQTPALTLQDIPMGNGTREMITNDAGEICYVNEYDENGNLIKSIHCNADGTIWVICEYAENGKYEKSTYYNGDGTVDFFVISEYEYEGDWKHDRSTFYDADGMVNFCELSASRYDENENEVERVSCYDDGTSYVHEIKEYDENGNQIKSASYDENGTPFLYVFYEYDENGEPTISTFCDGNGEVDYYIIAERGENGERGVTFLSADGTRSMTLTF